MRSSPNAPVRFQRPQLPPPDAVERYFAMSRAARYFSNGGPCVELLHERLAARVGVGCVTVANATLGLIAAVIALKRDGTEALMPSFTFPATVQAAQWAGLRPRFVDVDAAHWHMDPQALREALGASGRDAAVVIACSAFGTPPPPAVRRAWESACAEHGVRCVVDSAAGFGAASEDGVPIGAQGDAEVVSFHATKPFAVGEGGAVFSRDAAVVERVARIANFGLDAQRQLVEPLALNAKLSELHAATALAVLDGFDDVMAARRATARRYGSRLGDVGSFQAGSERSTWQFVPLLLSQPDHRDRCLRDSATVELRTYYEPLHQTAVYADAPGAGALEVTESIAARMLSLPMANDLGDDEVDRVCAAVRRGALLAA
jgi:dTDP-4-amino-4,6-dideoxygalactose transaminase